MYVYIIGKREGVFNGYKPYFRGIDEYIIRLPAGIETDMLLVCYLHYGQ